MVCSPTVTEGKVAGGRESWREEDESVRTTRIPALSRRAPLCPLGAYANRRVGGSYALRVRQWKIGARWKGLQRRVGMKVPFSCREC